MRYFFLALFVLMINAASAQLNSDPALEQVFFTDLAGVPIDDTMPLGYVARLNVPVKNLNTGNGVPAGTCKLKIGLGSKMNLAPGFNLSQSNTSNYFNWLLENTGGQWQLTGNLIATLPPGYADTARFNVQGIVLGYSTITANFLITNHNTPVILSDENPANNSSFRQYKIIPTDPIPVRFTGLSAASRNCNLAIRFTVENEWNLSHYDVELSANGAPFIRAAQIIAARRNQYEYAAPISQALSTERLLVRIRSVDADGSFRFSETVQVDTRCGVSGRSFLYPNPVHQEPVVLISLSPEFQGSLLLLELFDLAGRKLLVQQQMVTATAPIRVPVNGLAPGSYQIRISDNVKLNAVLRFVKQ
jgi:hypothetical protein